MCHGSSAARRTAGSAAAPRGDDLCRLHEARKQYGVASSWHLAHCRRPGHNTHRGPTAWERTQPLNKTAADPPSVSRCNGASYNRVPNSKQKSGGSKRNGKRNFSDKNANRELLLAEDGQVYANVTTRLGDGRFDVQCVQDGSMRLAHVRGKLWKRVWISPRDTVLITLRAFQDQKADIIHKYTDDEVRLLTRMGELPLAALGEGRDEDDAAHEAELQALRNVHGHARAGFLPTAEEFGFEEVDIDDI